MCELSCRLLHNLPKSSHRTDLSAQGLVQEMQHKYKQNFIQPQRRRQSCHFIFFRKTVGAGNHDVEQNKLDSGRLVFSLIFRVQKIKQRQGIEVEGKLLWESEGSMRGEAQEEWGEQVHGIHEQ